MQKLKKFIVVIAMCLLMGVIILQIPTIADWGDYETYDSSSSYDDWSDSSSDWGSSSSDWDSSSSSGWDWDDDDDYRSSSRSSSGDDFLIGYLFGILFDRHPLASLIGIIVLYIFFKYIYNSKKNTDSFLQNHMNEMKQNTMMKSQTKSQTGSQVDYKQIKEKVFGFDDTDIENQIQAEDPMFNKAEFLGWASDMFVKLQYAWSDRNLEEIRYFVTPELYEKTNNQVQRYISNKQINKLERVSVNISKLKSFSHEGDRDVLKVIFDTKMIDYIVDENTGKVLRGDPALNVMNPYILTFVRKSGVKTPEGGVKPVTMNCPNCGGATTILSSGKCPYCGSIITTRDNNWTLSEMSRYTPNS